MNGLVPIVFIIGMAIAAPGCSRSPAHAENPAAPVETAAHFKEGRGLQLSAKAEAFIGLDRAVVAVMPSGGNVLIPAEALLRTARGNFVFVENGGWWLRTPVVPGALLVNGFEIKEGLYEGDVVAKRGVHELWLAEIQAVNGGVGCADGH